MQIPEPLTSPDAANPVPGSAGKTQTRTVRIDLPPEGLRLESGASLPELTVAYETYGECSASRDNVVFICHALTGDAHAAGYHDDAEGPFGWWDEMIGPGKGIDTRFYHVVCANILGGCRGTTGPSSVNPATGKPYGSAFPAVTVGDMVTVHRLLLVHLGIERLAAVIGGSFGGMQVLEWAITAPEMVDRCICIASAARLSTQALAFDIVARNAIVSDPDWQRGDYYGTGRNPDRGLAHARMIGHITYLSPGMMARKFGRERRAPDPGRMEQRTPGPPAGFRSDFEVERYLQHQGDKLVRRFDANSYLQITRAMDEYDLAERHGTLDRAFAAIRSKMLVVALSSDWLFPPEQSVEIANSLLRGGKKVSYCRLQAPHGHDAFLVDIEHLAEVIRAFLPWVSEAARPLPRVRPPALPPARRQAFDRILDMIPPGSRVLDLGCGNGELLALLAARRSASGMGVDIDIRQVISVIDRGHDIFQADIDSGLAMIPDDTYDYAILSETLQVVRKPRFILHEMLRVARRGIVSFPNFANWRHRHYLFRCGRMPKADAIPFEWYDTPNIHLFTLNDFADLCARDGIRMVDVFCLAKGRINRMLLGLNLQNPGAERVLVKIERVPHVQAPVSRQTRTG